MKRLIFYSLILSVLLVSCKKEEQLSQVPILGLGGNPYVINDLDRYIAGKFTIPYNIEIAYRWDPNEVNIVKSMTPVNIDKVPDILDIIELGWLQPYLEVAGPDFLKKYSFSKFYLAGSGDYNSDNSKTVGVATGGVKIALYAINDLDLSDLDNFSFYLYILQHEFAHILHQTKFFPSSWHTIEGNTQYFTSNWVMTSQEDAYRQGFVRNYAKLSAEEDFVETISYLLVRGQAAYDQLKVDYPSKANVYRMKEEIVVDFYRDAVGINFRDLQAKVQNAIQTILSL